MTEHPREQDQPFSTVREALDALARGEFVVVVEDGDAESHGTLVMAAEALTEDHMATMMRCTSGLITCAMTNERADELFLPQATAASVATEDPRSSVDLNVGATAGISAADRARTCVALANPAMGPESFSRPGTVLTQRARPGGSLKRAGSIEAAVDLTTLAGCVPVAVVAELVDEHGIPTRSAALIEFARDRDLAIIPIADLVRYRGRNEKLVDRFSTARMPTPWGEFTVHVFRSKLDGVEHIAYVMGDLTDSKAETLVRVHSECLTGDIFQSLRCDCGSQLQNALSRIAAEERGVLLYLRGHEGRGIGLGHKMQAYALQDQGLDTVEANLALGFAPDTREYGIGAQILSDLGVSKMRLMTNNPAKYRGLDGFDLEIVERVAHLGTTTDENERYLATKRDHMGHLID